jgi:hypothetical protein
VRTATGVVITSQGPTPIRLFGDQSGTVDSNDQSGVISRIPSPVGAPLFVFIWYASATGEVYDEIRLAEPDLATYSYTCASGECTGPAEVVWRAMPVEQRQQYLGAALQAVRDHTTWDAVAFVVQAKVGAGGANLGCARFSPASPDVVFSPDRC